MWRGESTLRGRKLPATFSTAVPRLMVELSQSQAVVGRKLAVAGHRVELRIDRRAELHLDLRALQMALEIEVRDRSRGHSLELQRAVQHGGNGRGSLLSVGLEGERLQQLVVLGEIVHGEVDVQRGQGIAHVHAQHAGCRSRSSAATAAASSGCGRPRSCRRSVRAPAPRRGRSPSAPRRLTPVGAKVRLPSTCTVSRDVGGRASPLDLDGAADGGIEAEIAVVDGRGRIHDGAERNAVGGRGEIGMRGLHLADRQRICDRSRCVKGCGGAVGRLRRGLCGGRCGGGVGGSLAQPVGDAQIALRPAASGKISGQRGQQQIGRRDAQMTAAIDVMQPHVGIGVGDLVQLHLSGDEISRDTVGIGRENLDAGRGLRLSGACAARRGDASARPQARPGSCGRAH